jgi:hypothetical protein
MKIPVRALTLLVMAARKRFPWARLYVGIGTLVAIALAVWFVLKNWV